MKVIWVTSYNAAIWSASAKHLWKSFKEHKIPGKLLAGREEYNDGIPGFDVSKTEYRMNWLEENDDIVPPIPICNCPLPWSVSDADHTGQHGYAKSIGSKVCHHTWWNRNAYRWHNKIATLVEILRTQEFREDSLLFWIDSDCLFTQPITKAFLNDVLFPGESQVCYLRGDRKVIETGFFGIRGRYSIEKFIAAVRYTYKKRHLRTLQRWDDSYVIQHVLFTNHGKNFFRNDLATVKTRQGDVFPDSKIGQFITHDKGRHGRKQNIFH